MQIKYKNRYIKCFDKKLFVEYIMMCDDILHYGLDFYDIEIDLDYTTYKLYK